MLFLAFNNSMKPAIKKSDFKAFCKEHNQRKIAFVLASELALFIKCRGAIALSTADKMIDFDLTDLKLSKKDKSVVRNLIIDILNNDFNIKFKNVKCTDYNDEEFIKSYQAEYRIGAIVDK